MEDNMANKENLDSKVPESRDIKTDAHETKIDDHKTKIDDHETKAESIILDEPGAKAPIIPDHNVGKEGIIIENGKNRMKIRCAKCKLEDTLTEEDSKLLAHVVKRYNPNPVPEDYTAVLSIIKGNCTDGDKHLFAFDESFDKVVAETIKEYYDALSANVSRKETLEKISLLICETNSQIKSLGSTLLELEKKKEHIIAEMSAGGILIENIKLKFMKLTGSEDVTMWSEI